MLYNLFFLSLLIIIPLFIYQYYNIKYEDIYCYSSSSSSSLLSSLNGEEKCYFKKNYKQLKEQFIQLAQNCGAEIYHLPVIESDNLTTDIAILRGSKEKFLIHLSGTHGVEGYSGSAIQASKLHSLCYLNNSNPYPSETEPTLIFIHAVNPYGFHNNRRVNEDNIDLNRNFLTPEQFEKFQKRDPNHSGYETLKEFFNPSTPPLESIFLNYLNRIFITIQYALKVDPKTVKAALVTGTYHSPKGVFYGGNKAAKSVSNLYQFFDRDDIGLKKAKKYVVIDVHTGLGPTGVDTYFFHKEDNQYKSRAEKYFPTEYLNNNPNKQIGGLKPWSSGDAEAVEDGYAESAGFTTDYFCGELHKGFDPSSRFCLTQEFGTWSSLFVLKGFIDENQAFHYGNDEQKKFYGENLKNLFFVETKEWARSVVHRGTTAINEAINYLKESN